MQTAALPRTSALTLNSYSHHFAAYGFEKPSAIQQRAIVPVIKGHDTIAQAQSGTGKTGTFAISILQGLDVEDLNCQVRDMCGGALTAMRWFTAG